MKIRLFYHSVVSDWNHGNAHFLRGIAAELQERGHDVLIFEPADGWSVSNLRQEHGEAPIEEFHRAFPSLRTVAYDSATFDVEAVVAEADLVIVHEWTDAEIVRQVTAARRRYPFVLFFHDTHHRLVTDRQSMPAHDFHAFDGVLAYGDVLRDLYLQNELTTRAWTWHEAADTRVFYPRPPEQVAGDLVWVGNWGDDERTEELQEFLIGPAKELGLRARIYGVRYPDTAKAALAAAGIEYAGWLPNFEVPRVFSQFKLTVHVPRRPYVQALPGIPTIRPFEALACGLPLICSPWRDVEGLFHPGQDFLMVNDGREMKRTLQDLLAHEDRRQALAAHGLKTLRARHTCAHRVDQLMAIYSQVLVSRLPVPRRVATRRSAPLSL